MDFTSSVLINKSKEIVAKVFIAPESLKTMDGFLKKELLEGTLNETGSKNKLIYTKFEMTETVLENNLPHSFFAQYDHKHMSNTMKTNIEELSLNQTQISCNIEYTIFRGFIIKILAKISPGFFKKQTDKWLIKFKQMVESNY